MIIECQSCHARFRLDAGRIRGRGARVRCRRCGDSIIVLLEGRQDEVPAAPVSEGFLDLGSAVRDSLAGPPSSPPPGEPAPVPDNLIPFPAPARNPEPIAEEPPPPPQEDSPVHPEAVPVRESGGGKDEVDLAFERILSGKAEEPVAPPANEIPVPEPEIGDGIGGTVPAEPEAPPEPAGGADDSFLETHHHPPAAAVLPHPGEGGFLLGESETLDFLKESPRQEERPAPRETADADISFLLTASPVDDAVKSLRTPPPGGEPAPAADISPRLQATSPAEAPAGMTIEGNDTPLSMTPEVPVPPLREETPPPPRSEARPSPREETSPRPAGSKARILVAGLAVLVLAGAGYFGFTPAGRELLQTVAPGAAALLGGKASTAKGPAYDIRNVIGYYETGAGGRRILVIKGQVTNLSAREKSGIRVFAAIQDGAEKTLAEQTVYAGNVIPGDRLRKIDPPGAAKTLDNRFGEGLANMHVGPGKSVPFMVVFFDAPENIDSYRLEARDGE